MDFQDKIIMIDNTFSGYMNDTYPKNTFESGISDVLTSLSLSNLDKTFEATIVENTNEPFFGFRLFPGIDYLESITKAIIYDRVSYAELYERWKNIPTWIIEIDSKCFDRNLISLTPTELTTLLIHEIAKTAYADIVIERFYNALMDTYIKTAYSERADMRYLCNIYMIPIMKSCMLRDWVDDTNTLNDDLYIEHFIVGTGRGEEFATAVAKVIKLEGNSKLSLSVEKDTFIASSVLWCNQMCKDFIKRKNQLKDDVIYGILLVSSMYFKAVSLKIINDLGVGLRETYTGSAMECTLETIQSEDFLVAFESYYTDMKKIGIIENGMANEGFGSKKQKDLKLPSQYDIDAIEVEVDRISSHHDRIYVLDLIYEKLQELDDYEQYIASYPDLQRRHQPLLNGMRKQLLEMRGMVLEKKNFDKTYKVFVKVPEGYEG